MALLDSEIARIKAELGVTVVGIGAEPYIGITRLFENIIQPYTTGGATTTSSTSVTALSSRAPQQVSLTLASATGFAAGARVVVDVDSRQEIATAQSLSGASLTLLLSNTHSGTYPVTVEGGESIVRQYLQRCVAAGDRIDKALARAGIKKVDEVEFFSATEMAGMNGSFGSLWQAREMMRRELAEVLGMVYPRDIHGNNGRGATTAAY